MKIELSSRLFKQLQHTKPPRAFSARSSSVYFWQGGEKVGRRGQGKVLASGRETRLQLSLFRSISSNLATSCDYAPTRSVDSVAENKGSKLSKADPRAQRRAFALSSSASSSASSLEPGRSRPRYAIIGGGFAGLATCWNLLKAGSKGREKKGVGGGEEEVGEGEGEGVVVDVYDAFGVGQGGASAAASGLLHPLNTRGNVGWKGLEALAESIELMTEVEKYCRLSDKTETETETETEMEERRETPLTTTTSFVKQTGVFRFAKDNKQLERYKRIKEQWGDELLMQVFEREGKSSEKDGDLSDSDPSQVGYMFTPKGFVVDSPKYLKCLEKACGQLAQSRNSQVNVIQQLVASLRSLEHKNYSAIFICAGAAYSTIQELTDQFPLKLSETYAVEMTRIHNERECLRERGGGLGKQQSEALDDAAGGHSLLGRLYLVHPEEDTVTLGAVHSETSPEAAAALSCHHYSVMEEGKKKTGKQKHFELSPNEKDLGWSRVSAMAKEALEKGKREYPHFPFAKYELSRVHSGVRALPPKSNSGRLPLLGRVAWSKNKKGREEEEEVEEEEGRDRYRDQPPCWIFLGLGARGLLYHALLAKHLVRAVHYNDEGLLPDEVLRWK